MKLELGCGSNKKEGYIGVDIIDYSKLYKKGMFHTVNEGEKLPFRNNTFEEIRVHHVLEHVENLHRTMKELHRVAKPKAKIEITVPHRSVFGDEEDRRPFNYYSFTYYLINCPQRLNPKEKFFRPIHKTLHFKGVYKPFEWLMNIIPYIYEQTFLRNIIFCYEIEFCMEVVK